MNRRSLSILLATVAANSAQGFLQQGRVSRTVIGTAPTSKAEICSSGSRLFSSPEPLESEGDWQAFLDEETTGLVYYFDTITGESRWEPPTDTFPIVKLPRRKQRVADKLRKVYLKKRKEDDVVEDDKEDAKDANAKVDDKGETVVKAEGKEEDSETWIGTFSSELGDNLAEIGKQRQEAAGSFLGGMFGNGAVKAATKKAETKVEEVVEEVEVKVDPGTTKQPALGGMFSSFRVSKKGQTATEDANGSAAASAQQVQDEVVVVKEKRSSFMGKIFSSKSAAAAQQSTVEKKEEEVPVVPKPIKVDIAGYVSPHPVKIRWGGEDAIFIKGKSFGVFDGVSGAEKLDGVPLYSKTLASELKKSVGFTSLSIAEMTLMLTEAAEYADQRSTGASTAIMASIGSDGFLQVLNLGDSCCVVLRDGRITARTRDISHYFDCPYQLSEDSPDRPKDGTKLNVELISGDLIIMGSDGIFDNLTDDEIIDIATAGQRRSASIAKRIVDVSRKISLDETAKTPYAKQARLRGDPDYKTGLGGKLDDASCVVVLCS